MGDFFESAWGWIKTGFLALVGCTALYEIFKGYGLGAIRIGGHTMGGNGRQGADATPGGANLDAAPAPSLASNDRPDRSSISLAAASLPSLEGVSIAMNDYAQASSQHLPARPTSAAHIV